MTGRARGPGARARPRIQTPGAIMLTEEEAMADEEGNSSGEISGSGSDQSIRGRGGFKSSELITKPAHIENKVGAGGVEIKILANYFRINAPRDEIVFDYHLDFDPTIDSPLERKRLVFQFSDLFGDAFIYDGMDNIKSLLDLETPILIEVSRLSGELISIFIRQVGTIAFGCFEMLRLYNLQMRRNLNHLGLGTIGRYYYESRPVKVLTGHGDVGVHSGYLTAVNSHDGGIMTVVDSIFKFVRRDSVHDILRRIYSPSNPRWKEDIRKELIGLTVLTKYNNKTYRISDVDFKSSPNNVFTQSNGTSITYIDYYLSNYRMNLLDTNQPLLIAVSTERSRRTNDFPPPVRLIPELCLLTGLTDSMRADNAFMKKAAEVTKLKPETRVAQMKTFVQKFKSNPLIQKEMSRWRLQMEDHLVPLKGRFLEKENLLMGNGSSSAIKMGDFTKDIRGKTLYMNVPINRWALIYPKLGEDDAKAFLVSLVKVGKGMGISFANPKIFQLEDDKIVSFMATFQKIPPEAQMIVCLVGTNKKERYDAIKKHLCIEHPIPSQVVTARVIRNKERLMSVCTKIAIQIAAKTGSIPWALDIPPTNIMVIGFDSYHDSSLKGRSVGGFVASMNHNLTHYLSRAHWHETRMEMSNSMRIFMSQAVTAYTKENNGPPDRIIVYRDGVSEGMIQHVYQIEVNLIKQGITHALDGKSVPLTYIIVSKRINTRFYAVKDGAFLNPPCGTVVDTVVTRASRYDFFLVSQSVTEGTVSPTMFDIICDESGWGPTNHQKLAYKLTHLYFNWSGTVKVPAPCQYAHKLAFLCGQSLHKEPHARLERTLYYL